jgi:two-component system chemotaxis response regulator CheY
LIAEDHLLSRRILKEFLSPGFNCDIAVNGQEAIDSFVLAHESKQPYTAIFLDIMMPEVDGFQALKSIRELERKMEIPHNLAVKVIMTSALDDPHSVMKSFGECEADAYIVKPISRHKLANELRKLKLLP